MTLITTNPRTEIVRESFAEYQSFPALNHSALKLSDIHGKGCPAKAWAELCSKWKTTPEADGDDDAEEGDDKEDATAAMAFGTLYHSFLLEPGSFRKRAAILDATMMARLYEEAIASGSKAKGFSKALTTFKAWRATAEKAGLEVVTQKTMDKMEDMRAAMFSDPEIADELALCDRTESSIYFGLSVGDGGEGQIQCKARLDMAYPGVIGDLKTTRSAHPLEFTRDIAKLGYDTQLAWYRIAARKVGMEVSRTFLLAQESTWPYLSALHWMPESWLDYSTKEVRRIYLQFAACVRAGKFPGYGNGEILPPSWLEETIEMNA